MSRVRGILFDKDGTLIDFDRTWIPAYEAAAEHVAREAGKPALAARLMAEGGLQANGRWRPGSVLTSGTNFEIATVWAGLVGRDDIERITDEIEAIFHAIATGSPTPVVDLDALFGRLRESGHTLGIATMDSEHTARGTVDALALTPHLAFVCGFDSGHGTKPGPGMVEAFCTATGLAPDEVAMVGDSPHDLRMARAAGTALAIGVLSGTHGANELAPHADHVIGSIAVLERCLSAQLT